MRAVKTPWQENRRHHSCDKNLFFRYWQHLAVVGDKHQWQVWGLTGARVCWQHIWPGEGHPQLGSPHVWSLAPAGYLQGLGRHLP